MSIKASGKVYLPITVECLTEFEQDLRRCSLFETQDREDALAIRYRNNEFVIYHTDERAALWGVEYKFIHSKDAAQKFLELFHLG